MAYCRIQERPYLGELEIKFGLDEGFYAAIDDLKALGARFHRESRTWTINASAHYRIEHWART